MFRKYYPLLFFIALSCCFGYFYIVARKANGTINHVNQITSTELTGKLEAVMHSSKTKAGIRLMLKQKLEALEVYAGEYMEEKEGQAYFVFGVVGLLEADFRKIELLLQEAQEGEIKYKARIFSADFSIKELEELNQELMAELDSLLEEGVEVTSFGVDIMENRVVLGVNNLNEKQLKLINRRFNNHSALKVIEEEFYIELGGKNNGKR